MKLSAAIQFCFANRESWISGSGATTARINSGHVLRVLGDVDVVTLNSDSYKQLSQQLLDEGKSKSTVNRITSALSTILTELRQNGIDAPKVEFKRQKESRARATYFLEEEVDALLRAAAGERDGLLLHDCIIFAIKTGCRQGELLDLVHSDVDMEKQMILFRDTKNGSDHWIKMHEDLIPVLERRLALSIDAMVFPWENKDALLRAFKRAKRHAGLPEDDRVWHTLRHSVATWLCERQVPIRTVMGVLNHKRVETTLRYAKASDRAVASAIDLL
jgi:integrase